MTREENLSEFLGEHTGGVIPAVTEGIRNSLGANAESARESAVGAFSSLCGHARAMLDGGLLGDIAMITLSFLRVGLADGKGFYRMDACDGHWPVPKAPCFTVWEAKFAFDPFFESMRKLKEKVRKSGRGLREADLDAYIAECALLPKLSADSFLSGLAPVFGTHPAYEALPKAGGCVITLGEYRDVQAIVFPLHEEGRDTE
jgi:hypothetical protein